MQGLQEGSLSKPPEHSPEPCSHNRAPWPLVGAQCRVSTTRRGTEYVRGRAYILLLERTSHTEQRKSISLRPPGFVAWQPRFPLENAKDRDLKYCPRRPAFHRGAVDIGTKVDRKARFRGSGSENTNKMALYYHHIKRGVPPRRVSQFAAEKTTEDKQSSEAAKKGARAPTPRTSHAKDS